MSFLRRYFFYLTISRLVNQTNVLIDVGGNARLGDFGRAKLMDHKGYTTSFAGTYRWLAPELIDAPMDVSEEIDDQSWIPLFTKQTDVYALGMVLLEVRCQLSAAYCISTHTLHDL